jgi:hypothetical protein
MVKAVMVLAAYMALFVVVPQVAEMQVPAEARQTHALNLTPHDMVVVAQVLLALDHGGRCVLFGRAIHDPSRRLM